VVEANLRGHAANLPVPSFACAGPSFACAGPSQVRRYIRAVSIDDAPDAIAAGSVAAWYSEFAHALRTGSDAHVPCGSCSACCTSSQFVHIGPDEHDTLAHIPSALRFAAPRHAGHSVLPYDERGHCPMLAAGRCSIYEYRPRTCRVYDCRVFAATAVVPDEPSRRAVREQVVRWRFDRTDPADRELGDRLERAGRWIDDHQDDLPEALRAHDSTRRALSAFAIAELFATERDPTARDDPDTGAVVQLLLEQLE
jgi:hypothetical protein